MLRGQAAAAVGPERCLPSDCTGLRVFVPGAAQTETRYADFGIGTTVFQAAVIKCTSRSSETPWRLESLPHVNAPAVLSPAIECAGLTNATSRLLSEIC
jgi:hypothetical protein